ncbi:hypothetical protein RHGRI_028306 [Rhododendron griersonianum]|uniref:Methyltransferase n=1 Tax=Rhododendron griersonianum TaxID=479676 RepID=A0AAV6IFD0_9ERIC|nr:hypothetical protein RHGRI_028306 [Rhododendron griersonianum]
MAVSSSPQPPILSPLRLTSSSNLISSPPNLFLIAFPSRITDRRRRSAIVFSSKSKNDMASDRALLESYGIDPDEFLSEPSPPKVLGGKARRKKLISPKGQDVRPMMEVVKGAAFDILQVKNVYQYNEVIVMEQAKLLMLRYLCLVLNHLVDATSKFIMFLKTYIFFVKVAGGCPASLRPGRWLDLYSGTGSVGIEALSRGCSEVHFVEMDPWVVSDVLRPNLEWTGFLDVSVIHTVRVETFLEGAARSVGKDGPFNYISVTPPYTEVDYAVLMDQVSKSSLVGEDTFIVVEYPLRTDMLDSCGCLVKVIPMTINFAGSIIGYSLTAYIYEVFEYLLNLNLVHDMLLCDMKVQITDRRFGRTHLAIYGPKWAQKKRKPEKSIRAVAEKV